MNEELPPEQVASSAPAAPAEGTMQVVTTATEPREKVPAPIVEAPQAPAAPVPVAGALISEVPPTDAPVEPPATRSTAEDLEPEDSTAVTAPDVELSTSVADPQIVPAAGVEPVPSRGRGRGGGRRGGASKRGRGAAANAASSTSNTAGRGRGKRKSEAASLGQDGNGEPSAVASAIPEPRKKRKAAQAARRIIETDDEDEGDVTYELPADTSTMALDADPPSAQPMAPPTATAEAVPAAPAATVPAQVVQEKAAKKPRVTLKLKAREKSLTAESPVDAEPPCASEPAATQSLPSMDPATAEDTKATEAIVASEMPIAQPEEVQLPQMVHLDASAVVVPNAVPDLFADDENKPKESVQTAELSPAAIAPAASPSIVDNAGSRSVVPPDSATASKKAMAMDNNSKKKKAVPRPGADAAEKKAGFGSSATQSMPPGMKKAPLPKSGSIPNKLNREGGATPSSSTPIPGLMKKKPFKPAAAASTAGTSTPKVSGGTPVSSLQAETSFLDSLFADIQPQTEHERALQKEREEKIKKAEAEKAKADKKAKEEADATIARKKAAASIAGSTPRPGIPGSTSKVPGASVPPAGKSPAITLKSAAVVRQPGQSVLSRLGGSERLRQQEIEKMRTEARREQERLAQEGGFDLLAQGLEMAAFETPFLREWRSHQGMVFTGPKTGRPFPFYKGAPVQEEDVTGAQVKSLPHPWTFGSVFTFAGSQPSHEEEVWR